MDDARVGKHCSIASCSQQDYFPFQCNYCEEVFCGKHRRPDDHQCKVGGDIDSVFVIICPLCDMRIRIKPHENADLLWQTHHTSGECPKEQIAKRERDLEEASKPKQCQAEACKTKLTVTTKVTC